MAFFQNTLTLITGAASGIGRQLAFQAAERGSNVIATDWDELNLKETLRLGKAKNLEIEIQRLDVSNPKEIEIFAEKILKTYSSSKIILINNAGVAIAGGNFNDVPLSDFEWLLSINLWGVIRMTSAFLPSMMAKNQGHIVNVSSVFGFAGVQQQSAYCTAKFGVRGFTETIRMELMDTKIGVLCVHPGGIKTNIARNSRVSGDNIDPEIVAEGIKRFDEIAARTTADDAAKQILDAIEKRKTRLVIGADGKLLDWLTRFFPISYSRLMKTQMEKRFGNPHRINV